MSSLHTDQEGPAEGGDDDVPLGRLLPFSVGLHLEAVALCRDLTSKFELDIGDEDLEQTVVSALERSESRYGAFGGQVQRIGCAREFLKVLAGSTLIDEVRRVVTAFEGKSDSEPYQAVQRHLSPGDASNPGQYFDPSSWDVALVEAADADERVYRLALFVQGMLDQEDGLREAGATSLEAAERAVYERRLGPSTGPE